LFSPVLERLTGEALSADQPKDKFGDAEGTPVVGELVGLAVQLAMCVALAAALLRLVPQRASRAWATSLLVLVALGNLGPVIGLVVASFRPPSIYLETDKNRLEFNRDVSGEVVGVRVNNPPPESLTYLHWGERTWALALATITLTLTALALWRRAVREAPGGLRVIGRVED
jgi:hypothetical protein